MVHKENIKNSFIRLGWFYSWWIFVFVLCFIHNVCVWYLYTLCTLLLWCVDIVHSVWDYLYLTSAIGNDELTDPVFSLGYSHSHALPPSPLLRYSLLCCTHKQTSFPLPLFYFSPLLHWLFLYNLPTSHSHYTSLNCSLLFGWNIFSIGHMLCTQ